MAKGYNLAEKRNAYFAKGTNDICVFLSHIRIDKPFAIEIGEYIKEKYEYNIYLDIEDEELQKAVDLKDPKRVTACIEKGIEISTHIMCILSEKTVNSWWVPYEIGFGKKSNKAISTLLNKDTQTLPSLPEYLLIGDLIKNISILDEYLRKINPNIKKSFSATGGTIYGQAVSNSNLEKYLIR